MAFKQQTSTPLFLLFLTSSLCIVSVSGQTNPYYGPYYQQNNPYNNYDPYNPPNPGDRDYRTYTYNNRRYGQYSSNIFNGRGQPGDPRLAGQDVRFTYDRVSSKFKGLSTLRTFKNHISFVCISMSQTEGFTVFYYEYIKFKGFLGVLCLFLVSTLYALHSFLTLSCKNSCNIKICLTTESSRFNIIYWVARLHNLLLSFTILL